MASIKKTFITIALSISGTLIACSLFTGYKVPSNIGCIGCGLLRGDMWCDVVSVATKKEES